MINSLVVENLRQPDVLNSTLRGLGARHVKYGALPEHYPLVGSALLTTFEQYLGEKWTPDVKQAWTDAYVAISEIMLDGADYSQAEIALPTPGTPKAEAEAEITLKPQPSNTEIAPAQVQPLSYSGVNGTSASIAAESETFSYDSGKATIAAFAGGGIMAIIATILALLF